MNIKKLFKPGKLGERGFTLAEILVSVTILAVISISAMIVIHNSSRAKRVGDNLSMAQQNARSALNAIVSDLRTAGYSLDEDTMVPVEVASDYRVTMVLDRNRNGDIDNGERITYFLDTDQSQQLAADSENPYDYVLRRVVNTDSDSMATPTSGAGEIVAYLMTQRSTLVASSKDTPLFTYMDETGADLMGEAADPDNSGYGFTVGNTDLGLPVGTGLESNIAAINVHVVTETATAANSDGKYRRFALGSQFSPPNFSISLAANFEAVAFDSSYDGGDSTIVPPADTTVTDTTDDEWLPPYEPPIRISTARVLSLASEDLSELDSQEGSETSEDYQYDMDLVLGTKAGGSNNLSVWLNGQPGLYSGATYYNQVPNYYGTSPFDIQDIALENMDYNYALDAVCAVKVSDTSGGFQVWFNQDGNPGTLGLGSGVTTPNNYYSNTSGQGLAILAIDVDGDYDKDVVLGTRTGPNSGEIEVWLNDGTGTFSLRETIRAEGEVNALAAADLNVDGFVDIVAGTKKHADNKTGSIDVYINRWTTYEHYVGYESGGRVNALAIADMDDDGSLDIIAGTRTGINTGEIEFWKHYPGYFVREDKVAADGPVLCVDVGYIDLDYSLDVVAGNEDRTVQAWFCNPELSPNVLPETESWADANAGGEVHAVKIIKVEEGYGYTYGQDQLYDIIAGTAITTTEGEIVIYLNPFVWTIGEFTN